MSRPVYHLGRVTGEAICGAEAPSDRVVDRWSEVPDGAKACLRCVRKINYLRINAKVPAHMVPPRLR